MAILRGQWHWLSDSATGAREASPRTRGFRPIHQRVACALLATQLPKVQERGWSPLKRIPVPFCTSANTSWGGRAVAAADPSVVAAVGAAVGQPSNRPSSPLTQPAASFIKPGMAPTVTPSDGRLLSCPPPPQSSTQHSCFVNCSNGQGVELRIPSDQGREIRLHITFLSGSAYFRVDANQYEKVRGVGSGLCCFLWLLLSNASRRVESRLLGAADAS